MMKRAGNGYKAGCALMLLALVAFICWSESEAPLRTDVEPLQRRLVLDGGISSAQWRARMAMEDGWGPPVQDNYVIINGMLEISAVAELFATVDDARFVVVGFEEIEAEALESPTLLARLNEQRQVRRDKELKPCCLKRFAWCRQRNRVYIELECP